jgi:Na+/H+-translocating membrane pyrophosphatase
MLMVGFGFGASFVALFMQLGGGIYTKAADVGADMVGKIEVNIAAPSFFQGEHNIACLLQAGIPEDDPRNPAVIADLVGDMVGDCVGSSADIFESVAAEIIGAMILGATLGKEEGLEAPIKFVLFPLVVHAVDILVSSIGILSLRAGPINENPMKAITRSYRITAVLAVIGFCFTCKILLDVPGKPSAWLRYAACGIVGIANGYVFIQSTQFFTDYEYQPVRDIADASITGHGTNIITGVSVGMKSTVIPVLSVSTAVLIAYHLGASTGVGTPRSAGL